MINKDLGLEIVVPDEKSGDFRKNGFTHSREKNKRIEWGDCTSFFKGSKSNHIRCVAQKTDVEKMVQLGFVVNAERLPDVHSSDDNKRGARSLKSGQRTDDGKPPPRTESVHDVSGSTPAIS